MGSPILAGSGPTAVVTSRSSPLLDALTAWSRLGRSPRWRSLFIRLRWTWLAGLLAIAAALSAVVEAHHTAVPFAASALMFVVVAQLIDLVERSSRLSDRLSVYERVAGFGADVHATLDIDELARAAARAARHVVDCDAALLVTVEPDAPPRVRAIDAERRPRVGVSALPDPRIAERAIHDQRLVLDPRPSDGVRRINRSTAPSATRMAAPILSEARVVGALALVRPPSGRAFDESEVQALVLMAGQLGRAFGNVETHAEAVEASLRDALTGISNRRYLDSAIERMNASRRRLSPAERVPLAAILFDLDHFGNYNKEHGHLAGDDVLRNFGSILRQRTRAGDVVARYGGEEFLVVLERADAQDALRLADTIRATLSADPVDGTPALGITTSAGCADLPAEIWDARELIARADTALAVAKAEGRDRACLA